MGRARGRTEEGSTVAEIQALIGVGSRTLTKYASLGLIDSPKPRGRHTVHTPENVTRIAAIQALQRDGYLLREMRHALSNYSREGLAALAWPKPAPASDTERAAPPAPSPAGTAKPPNGDAWVRVTLLPGLELNVAAGATAFVQRIASEIAERYAAK